MRKLLLFLCLLVPISAFGQEAKGREHYYDVTITNLSKAQTFSPSVAVVHSDRMALFTPGEAASDGLTLLAEDGDAAALMEEALESPQVYDAVISDGLLDPGESVTLRVKAYGKYSQISVVGMLVTTNDAFYGLSSVELPFNYYFFKNRSRSIQLTADVYDSGTEANTEDCDHIPIPCGNFGVRMTEGAEGFVHIHSGFHGIGDLDEATYDWRNPGAGISITKVR